MRRVQPTARSARTKLFCRSTWWSAVHLWELGSNVMAATTQLRSPPAHGVATSASQSLQVLYGRSRHVSSNDPRAATLAHERSLVGIAKRSAGCALQTPASEPRAAPRDDYCYCTRPELSWASPPRTSGEQCGGCWRMFGASGTRPSPRKQTSTAS